jgi:tRNA(fMet)-specific endonuclease VapC
MKYLLDSDHASILEWRTGAEYAVLVAQINTHADEGIGVSVVSFHEQALGANQKISQARTPEKLVRAYELMFNVIELYRSFPVIKFDTAAQGTFESLKANKIRIGTMDLRIAATALAHNLTVVTRNASDFGKVPGLRTEDWTR